MKRAIAFVFVVATCAIAHGQPFLSTSDVDLLRILPPPPADDSAQTRSELAEILAIQASRTPAMEARVREDSEETVWRFADMIGPKVTKESLIR
jgi:acid phosphatase (class A)